MDTAARLTRIWSRVLQSPDVGPDSDFFELGGDSLTAVGLFLEIERELDRKLPITAIYDAPTIAGLAQLIDGEASPEYCHLVPLKAGDERAPIFLVHGVGGVVMELAALGKSIRSEKAVYAIQARGLNGIEPPLHRVDDMSALYAELIRRKQPQGPYFIGGYSFGGVIAVEIARRLGPENVAQLLMIDSFAHPRTWPLRCRIQVRIRKIAKQVRATARRPLGDTASRVLKKIGAWTTPRTPEQRAADRAAYVSNWLGAVDPELPLPLRQTRVAGDAALVAFKPYYYPGKVTFVRARRPGAVFPANALAVWRGLVAGIELYTTEGDHRSILDEHAPELAGRISSCLAPSALHDKQLPSASLFHVAQPEPS